MTTLVRPPAVAGLFYPDDPKQLVGAIDMFLDTTPPDVGVPLALIVPHAGYRYSGSVAGIAYAALAPVANKIARVLLLGPAHRAPVRGMAVPSVSGFETPLGVVPVDTAARAEVMNLSGIAVDDAAHSEEHSLEVHLPFLQRVLGEFSVLPIVVGHAPAPMVADVIDHLWHGPETLVIVSTDLSHYETYDSAVRHDRHTAASITGRRPEEIAPLDACGCFPVRGLLEAVRRRDLSVRLVDLRNSGDTAGDRTRVVGYGAFVVSER